MIIKDDDRNQIGHFENFKIEMKTLPTDLRVALLSFIGSSGYKGKLIYADCQILITCTTKIG